MSASRLASIRACVARRILACGLILCVLSAGAVAADLHLSSLDGAPLASPYTLAPGETLEFRVQGASGAATLTPYPNEAGVVGELQATGEDTYRYTVPATGAFAGGHRIEVRDAEDAFDFTVRVPLHASWSAHEALGGPDGVQLTVRGAQAGESLNLAVQDERGLPSEALALPTSVPPATSESSDGNPLHVEIGTVRVSETQRVRVAMNAMFAEATSPVVTVLPAQEYAGVVYGTDGAPLEGARVEMLDVTVAGRGYHATTDGAGRFALLAPRGDTELRVSAERYEATTVPAPSCASDAIYHPVCTVTLTPPEGDRVLTPSFEPEGGTLSASSSGVRIISATAGAQIRYTLDGTVPTREHGEALENGGVVVLEDSAVLMAMAYLDGMADSEVAVAEFEVADAKIPAPSFDPPAGTYDGPVTVTVSASARNATIAYTLDGSEPSPRNGIQLPSGGSFELHESTHVRAVAFRGSHSSKESTLLLSAASATAEEEYESSDVVDAHFLIQTSDHDDTLLDDEDETDGNGGGHGGNGDTDGLSEDETNDNGNSNGDNDALSDDDDDDGNGNGDGGNGGDILPPPDDDDGDDDGNGNGDGGNGGDIPPPPDDDDDDDDGNGNGDGGNGGDILPPPDDDDGDDDDDGNDDGNGNGDGGNGGDIPPPPDDDDDDDDGNGNGDGGNGGDILPPPDDDDDDDDDNGNGDGGNGGDILPPPDDDNGDGNGEAPPEDGEPTADGPRIGGGGGCALRAGDGRPDPLLPLLMLLAVWRLRRGLRRD